MSGFRKFIVGLLVTVFVFSSLGTAWSFVGHRTVRNREVVKSWLDESGIYDEVVSIALSNAEQSGKEAGTEVKADDPGVKAVASKTFSPAFLRENSEKVINGAYDWLDGKTETPVFAVDLSSVKQQFATNLGTYASEKAASLPTCTPEQVTPDFDPLSAACLPPGTTPAQAGKLVTDQLLSDDGFLKKTELNGNDVQVDSVPIGQTRQGKIMRLTYKFSAYLPVAFGVLALLSALGVIFLSQTRTQGLKRVGISSVVVGVILGISYFILGQGTKMAEERIATHTNTKAISEILIKFAGAVESDMRANLIWFVIGFLAGGIALILISLIIGRPRRSRDDRDETPVSKPANIAPPKTIAGTTPVTTNDVKPTTAPPLPRSSAPSTPVSRTPSAGAAPAKPKRPPRKIQL